jgi:hypothetical protein
VFFVWRGWGPVGLAALILPLVSCVGFMDWNPPVAMFAFGITLTGGGLVCRHYGRKWNQGSGTHMMYWVPLEVWGWIYLVIGFLFSGLGATALIVKVAQG